jgi:prepilin-type processing-associated H-X9-DG protein
MGHYQDALGTLPAVRLCPDLPKDPQCNCLQNGDVYSGPAETWWAPYDNRVGPGDPALPDYDPSRALLWPYIEGTAQIFRCPQGVDVIPDSPTLGQPLQASYAMNHVTGGPSATKLSTITNGNGTSNVMLAWDHANLPACSTDPSTNCAPRVPLPFTGPQVNVHYPQRHGGIFNVLFCDGHVTGLTQSGLSNNLFYVLSNVP